MYSNAHTHPQLYEQGKQRDQLQHQLQAALKDAEELRSRLADQTRAAAVAQQEANSSAIKTVEL